MEKIIQICEKDYYLFDEYGTREIALKIAKEFKRERKCKYFILKAKEGGLMKNILPSYKFGLYLSKKIRITW